MSFMKSRFGFFTTCRKESLFSFLFEVRLSKKKREQKSAVNRLIMIPKERVTANPLIGPVPKRKSAIAVIKVVTWESTMVQKDLLKPPSTLDFTDFPSEYSSLILSKMRTFASTAIPMERTIPAIPGRVSVALRTASPVKRKRILSTRAVLAIIPDDR